MDLVRREWPFLVFLTALALFIWLRDLRWATASDDTLPILVSLPLFFWLGAPWKLRSTPLPAALTWLVLAGVLFLTGILFNSTLLLAIAWVVIVWTWIKAKIDPERFSDLRQLLILPLMAFPWVTLDLDRLGWWFRLSGAWATSHIFSQFGYGVDREGTVLLIDGLPVSVDAACSGLNTLQAMLIAGSVINYLMLGGTFFYWLNIPLLFVLAWVANTIRIIGISFAAISVSPEFAMGLFHTWGGWAILMVMFLSCMGLFFLEEKFVFGRRER